MKNSTFEINAEFIAGENKYKRMTEKNKTLSKFHNYQDSRSIYMECDQSHTTEYYDYDDYESESYKSEDYESEDYEYEDYGSEDY